MSLLGQSDLQRLKWVTAPEAATLCGVTPATIYRHIRAGVLETDREITKIALIPVSSLIKAIEAGHIFRQEPVTLDEVYDRAESVWDSRTRLLPGPSEVA